MNFFEKTYINLYAKSSDSIVSKDGHFEFRMPTGFRSRHSEGMYQIFKPNDKGFLFQWQGFVLPDEMQNQFDIDLELKNELNENPNAEIQTTGNYDCVCSATVTEDKKEIVYTWKIGEKNKRILVTLFLDGQQPQEVIDDQIYLVGQFMKELKIKHTT
ncbi:MAG: hypothetical protein JKY52_16535 [Flavobacteriales bacterium]|nr:hypothetical protein [Flavobacteriales bacterium]